MRKLNQQISKSIIITLTNLLIITSVFAQAPESFTYQAIVRDNSGQPLPNSSVTFQFNILQGSASGTIVYSEDQTATTNDFGLVNLQIGQGTVQSGNFSTIEWGNDAYFLNIQIDQGSGFVDMGTQQFISVPYAMYAKNAGSSGVAGNTGDVQFNNSGSLDADPDLHWDINDKKLVVGQDTSDGRMIIQQDPNASDSIPILEVKNKAGQTIFVVYPDSVHIFIGDDNSKGVLKGGFAVSGRSGTKAPVNDYLLVRPDSTRISFNKSGAKGVLKGGFAVSGRSGTKSGVEEEYFNISPNDSATIINPSEPRILWYPVKEAFLSGRVLIESPDSVGTNSMATGYESKAVGDFSQAMGYKAIARGLTSTSIGDSSVANGVNSYAFGSHVFASDSNSYAFGQESAALAKASFVFGQGDTATAESAMALGFNTNASGNGSLSMGIFTVASGKRSVAMGSHTTASGESSLSTGENTQASGNNSIAMGFNSMASGMSSLAMGDSTMATNDDVTSMGFKTVANGAFSIAMGNKSMAEGGATVAMGDSTEASGYASLALGSHTWAIGDNSTAMGYNTVADGVFSTAMGYKSHAHGTSSFAIGSETTANGDASIAMGSNSIADGNLSIATGNTAHTIGEASVSIGLNTISSGDASAAFGISTNATSMGSFVVGSYNEPFAPVNSTDLTSDLFVVANGVMGTPHNALTVLKIGNVGINTNTPDKLLTVVGDARVTGNIYYGAIGSTTTYNKPDFVFKSNYNKDFDITDIEKFIKKNGHLPWLTAAKDEKNGVNMTRMSFQTLEAVENQQLQIIELKKENQALLKRVERLEKKLK